MRHFLIAVVILLCPAAPALAQVTVDLHALDALPGAPESPGRRPSASLPPLPPPAAAERPNATAAERPNATAAERQTGPASRHGVASEKPTAPPAVAAAKPATRHPGVAAAQPTAPTVASAQPTAPAPPASAQPQSPAAPQSQGAPQSSAAPQSPPPAATLPGAPPSVASIVPIQPPAPPANAPPPPAPPITAGAATKTASTAGGLRLTFAGGQSDLNSGSADSIKHLVQAAPSGDATTFNVLAYASGDPDDPSAARRLSLARAIAIRAALMADGVPSSRIYLRALGAQPGEGPPDRVDLSVLGANASSATGAQ